MSSAKAKGNSTHNDAKYEDNKESDAEYNKSTSLVDASTTKAKEVAGFMVDKIADGMAFATEKIKDARK